MAEKSKKTDKPVTYLLRNVPVDTYREAQRFAKRRGMTLRTQILLLLEGFVKTSRDEEEKNNEN